MHFHSCFSSGKLHRGVNIQPNVTTCLNDQSKLAQYGEQRRLNEVEC